MQTHFKKGLDYFSAGICTDSFNWGIDLYGDNQSDKIAFGWSFANGVLEVNLSVVTISITTPFYFKRCFSRYSVEIRKGY